MKLWKRLIYYLFLNVLVSACTTLVVLAIWDRTHPTAEPAAIHQTEPAISALGTSTASGQLRSAPPPPTCSAA